MADQYQDLLLRYCLALDVGNFDDLGKVLEMAQKNEGLEAAISGIHARFDTNESWVRQLQTYRQQMSQKVMESEQSAMIESGRMIDLINHLPPGAKLSTTGEFERTAKRTLQDASILQACSTVIDAGYQDNDAEVSADGKTVSIYAGGKWIPWPAFTIRYEESE